MYMKKNHIIWTTALLLLILNLYLFNANPLHKNLSYSPVFNITFIWLCISLALRKKFFKNYDNKSEKGKWIGIVCVGIFALIYLIWPH